jgi:HEAT repeat protein
MTIRCTSRGVLHGALLLGVVSAVGASRRLPAQPLRSAAESMLVATPQPVRAQDPADSLLTEAQAALRRNDLRRAATLFQTLRERHPRSRSAENAGYWEAFARHRLGGQQNLTQARAALAFQTSSYPNAATRADVEALSARIARDAAMAGDAAAAQQIVERSRTVSSQCPREDEDERLMVLDALLSMDAERAMPTLKTVMARRDECTAVLRRKAVFLISRKQTPETEELLLTALRADPDPEVREQAVFWLGSVNTERATNALIDLLRSAKDGPAMEQVVISLSQQRNDRARAALRELIANADAPVQARGTAIHQLAQREADRDASVRFLTELYPTLRELELKERVLFALAQRPTPAAEAFLTRLALDPQSPLEARRTAILYASRLGLSVAQLRALYRSAPEREIREQVVFAIGSRKTEDAVDALLDIARTDGDREMRRAAIFWLGQSKDPRVPGMLQQLLDR